MVVFTVVKLVGVRVRVLLGPNAKTNINVSKEGMAVVVTLDVQMTDEDVRVSHTMKLTMILNALGGGGGRLCLLGRGRAGLWGREGPGLWGGGELFFLGGGDLALGGGDDLFLGGGGDRFLSGGGGERFLDGGGVEVRFMVSPVTRSAEVQGREAPARPLQMLALPLLLLPMLWLP